uniref:Uncharacterized protein n=1 Tax=Heterorhabditis bacteriophora TaxID=37862 RepID=A0A1I7WX25_HETBA
MLRMDTQTPSHREHHFMQQIGEIQTHRAFDKASASLCLCAVRKAVAGVCASRERAHIILLRVGASRSTQLRGGNNEMRANYKSIIEDSDQPETMNKVLTRRSRFRIPQKK